MHPCPGNSVATGRAVEYYALTARVFGAGIEFWPCTLHLILEGTSHNSHMEGVAWDGHASRC